jgi:hypothetical protein
MNALTPIGLLILAISVFGLVAGGVYEFYLDYQYEKVIGSHMDNAYDMNTPSRMKYELLLAKDGMMS